MEKSKISDGLKQTILEILRSSNDNKDSCFVDLFYSLSDLEKQQVNSFLEDEKIVGAEALLLLIKLD